MAIVYVVDVSPGGYPSGSQYVPSGPNNLFVPVSDTMDTMSIVQSIERSLRPGMLIEKLHLASHGNSGELFMGMGISIFSANEFRRLSSRFIRRAFQIGILIHGCAVASAVGIAATDGRTDFGATPGSVITGFGMMGMTDDADARYLRSSRGYQFLRALAGAAGVGVMAAFNAQDVDRVGHANWAIEGATLTVWPQGHARILDPFQNIEMGHLTENSGREYCF